MAFFAGGLGDLVGRRLRFKNNLDSGLRRNDEIVIRLSRYIEGRIER
jgi:hypothetical protein